nr:MAG TPA: hypothetical protein [Caudoviricetes sp.]
MKLLCFYSENRNRFTTFVCLFYKVFSYLISMNQPCK